MQTRNRNRIDTNLQSKKKEDLQSVHTILPKYDIDIDFDEASYQWRCNKKSVGNGCFVYKCIKMTKSNKLCSKKCFNGELYCYIHNKSSKNNIK